MAVGKFWPGSARASCAASLLVENDRSGPKDIARSRWPDSAPLSVEVNLGSLFQPTSNFRGRSHRSTGTASRNFAESLGIGHAVKLEAESLFDAAVRGLHADWFWVSGRKIGV